MILISQRCEKCNKIYVNVPEISYCDDCIKKIHKETQKLINNQRKMINKSKILMGVN